MTVLLPQRRLEVIKAGGDSEMFKGVGERPGSHAGDEVRPLLLHISRRWWWGVGSRVDVRRLGWLCRLSWPPVEVPLSPRPPGPPVEAASTARPPHAGTDLLLTLTALLQQTPPLLRTPQYALLLVSPGYATSTTSMSSGSNISFHHEDLLVVV